MMDRMMCWEGKVRGGGCVDRYFILCCRHYCCCTDGKI